jgi:hypothetical protein
VAKPIVSSTVLFFFFSHSTYYQYAVVPEKTKRLVYETISSANRMLPKKCLENN